MGLPCSPTPTSVSARAIYEISHHRMQSATSRWVLVLLHLKTNEVYAEQNEVNVVGVQSTVATAIRAIQAIEIRLKNDLNSDRFLWGFFCRQQWTYSYGKRAQTNQSRKFVIYFLPKSAAILTQKKPASCPVSGPPHTPQCLLGELWRAHADKKNRGNSWPI